MINEAYETTPKHNKKPMYELQVDKMAAVYQFR